LSSVDFIFLSLQVTQTSFHVQETKKQNYLKREGNVSVQDGAEKVNHRAVCEHNLHKLLLNNGFRM